MRHVALILVPWLLVGCATVPLDRKALLNEGIAEHARVTNVPLVEQDRNQCGPAALSMALGWAGKWVPEEDLVGRMMTPGKKGTFQADLIAAVRRQGFLALPVKNYRSLLREIESGHPVVVLENLGLSWMPQWHYSVVVGYDLDRSELELHSGRGEVEHMSLRRFDLAWDLADRWAIVVLPPSVLSPSADEIDHLEAAAVLERMGFLHESTLAYRAILTRWPKSLGAWIGLANVRFSRGEPRGAAVALERAVRFHPEAAVSWHNLAQAYSAMNRPSAARRAARRAVEAAPPPEEGFFQESLRPILGE